MTPEFLPWQRESASQWLKRGESLAHAWLLHGQSGIGKRQLGLSLAASLLCESPINYLACGKCQACLWVKLDNHPDLMRVRPEAQMLSEGLHQDQEASGQVTSTRSTTAKPSEIIKVDQIRALEPWYHRTTHRAGWRVVLLYPAESMMAESANALLKALEEPPPNTMFLLITDSIDRLLPTILSRCQRYKVPFPDRAVAQTWLIERGVQQPDPWLDMAGGAPLKALSLSESADSPYPQWLQDLLHDVALRRSIASVTLAETLSKWPASQWLAELQKVCVDLCLCGALQQPRYFTGLAKPLQQIATRQTLQALTRLQSDITQRMSLAQHPLNAKLFAQDCLRQFIDTLL